MNETCAGLLEFQFSKKKGEKLKFIFTVFFAGPFNLCCKTFWYRQQNNHAE